MSTLGKSTFDVPVEWTEIRREKERLTFAAPDGKLQTTVSLMCFGIEPSWENFKRLCSLRYEAEKQGPNVVFLQPEYSAPFEEEGKFGMFFSGEEKKVGRLFSGFLTLQGKELITIYVEGLHVDSENLFKSFHGFVSNLKQER